MTREFLPSVFIKAPSELTPIAEAVLPLAAQGLLLRNRAQRRGRPLEFEARVKFAEPRSTAAKLAGRLSGLQTQLAAVSMYIDNNWRSGLAKQINFLLRRDEWPVDTQLPSGESFSTLLRLVVFLRPLERPSLGVADDGNLTANWVGEGHRLFIEFLPADQLRRSASQFIDGQVEATAGATSTDRLPVNLNVFHRARWFANA